LAKKSRFVLGSVVGWLILAPALIVGAPSAQQDSASTSTTAAPVQPLPFSHKKHLSFQLSCKFCHTNPEPGNLMTLPAAQTCMGCHATVAVDKPGIQQLAAFAKSQQPIPWKPIYSVPGFVYWSHRTHLEAGLTCEMCHGKVAQMEAMSRTTNVTTMAGCVACHRQKEAPTGCETCHESQSSLLSRPSVPRPVEVSGQRAMAVLECISCLRPLLRQNQSNAPCGRRRPARARIRSES
jgi:c(7)-type cytochrome triheme protein